jgi:hypothetical protein
VVLFVPAVVLTSVFGVWCDGGPCAMSWTVSMFSALPSSAPQMAASVHTLQQVDAAGVTDVVTR